MPNESNFTRSYSIAFEVRNFGKWFSLPGGRTKSKLLNGTLYNFLDRLRINVKVFLKLFFHLGKLIVNIWNYLFH